MAIDHMRRWIPSTAVLALAAGGLSALSGSGFSLQAQQQAASTVSQPPQLEFVEQVLHFLPRQPGEEGRALARDGPC